MNMTSWNTKISLNAEDLVDSFRYATDAIKRFNDAMADLTAIDTTFEEIPIENEEKP